MSGRRMRGGSRPGGDDADKAFWISFADLMTALMVLFMMVMAVSLLSITRAVSATNAARSGSESRPVEGPERAAVTAGPASGSHGTDVQADAVETLMHKLAQAVQAAPGVQLDARRHVIDFGDRARFDTGSSRLDGDSRHLLRRFAPSVLAVADSELGRRWIRRVVVEGFADPRGTYFYNLNLSLQRGQRVMCALLDDEPGLGDEEPPLDPQQRARIQELFAVGGFAFNDQRESLDASRRIELRIEFGPPAQRATADVGSATGRCALPA